jgi:hypothetical protein
MGKLVHPMSQETLFPLLQQMVFRVKAPFIKEVGEWINALSWFLRDLRLVEIETGLRATAYRNNISKINTF